MSRDSQGRGFRGSPRGGPNQPRGRGGRGRGRGGWRGGRGRGIGYDEDLDFVLQFRSERDDVPHPSPHFIRGRGGHNRGANSPRGRVTPKTPNSRSRPMTPVASGSATPVQGRGRGRGIDTTSTPGRGRGADTHTSTRGGQKKAFNKNAPLSKLLYQDRPYLRPVIFVKSQHTPRLFEEQEEIFETMNEDESEAADHVPTADRVFKVFHHETPKDAADEGGASEEIEEIDFEDMGKMREEVDKIAMSIKHQEKAGPSADPHRFTGSKVEVRVETSSTSTEPAVLSTATSEIGTITTATTAVEETGFYADVTPATTEPETVVYEALEGDIPIGEKLDSLGEDQTPQVTGNQPTQLGFYVDTGPAAPERQDGQDAVIYDRSEVEAPLGSKPADEDDEVIVFISPQQIAAGTSSREETRPPSPSTLPAPAFSSVSLSFGNSPARKQQRRYANRPKSLLANWRGKKGGRRRGLLDRAFGSFGAAREERELWGDDPRREERRRGDDDVVWGDESEESEGEGKGSGDMTVDADVDLSVMQRFVENMGPKNVHMSAGDLEDMERIQAEDEQEDEVSSEEEDEEGDEDEEEELVFDEEERVLIAEEGAGPPSDDDEDEDDDDDDDDDSDVDESPRRGFQARLERLRNASKGKQVAKDPLSMLDTLSDDDVSVEYAPWSDDDDFVAAVQDFIDGNEDILNGRSNRKERNKLFRAIQQGTFDELEEFAPAKRRKDKGKDLPPELQDQWQRDRAKKAEYKRQREHARIEAAADPLARKKGGKKGRKTMRAAARLDPSIEVPNRVVNMVSLERQIRRFIADIGGSQSMALPPCDKGTRKIVHELAGAFNLTSKSKGSGADRYTTLIKTTKTGVYINEKKVTRIMRRFKSDYGGAGDGWGTPGGKGRRVPAALPKHREGDEVGKAAPKIDSTNVGFRMLAGMGWSDGDRIGLSGGLEAPLAAVYKKTKLGLGATL